MAFKEQLIDALYAALGPGTGCHLHVSTTGRVGGLVVSPAFSGMEQHERQQLIWDALKRRFSSSDLQGVMALLTLTPDEASDLDDEVVDSA